MCTYTHIYIFIYHLDSQRKFHTAPAGGAGDLGPPNEIPLTRLAETTVGADYRKSFFQKDIPSVHIFCAKKIKRNKVSAKVNICPRRTNDSIILIDLIIDKIATTIYPMKSSKKGFLYVS